MHTIAMFDICARNDELIANIVDEQKIYMSRRISELQAELSELRDKVEGRS
jgi:hypothetical protein